MDGSTPETKQRWQDVVARYSHATPAKSWWQITDTFVPFAALWALSYHLLTTRGLLWSLPVSCLATCLLVRIYMLQHDCGHGSFFKSQRGNDILGSICGVFTLMPYFRWRHDHAVHHATNGNLSKRGTGDVWTMTLREYQAASPGERFKYRLFRNPFILFGVGSFFLFVIWQRFPGWSEGKREVRSVWFTNLMVALIVGGLGAWLGFGNFLLVQGPITLLGSAWAVWLFYMQHQYEETYWAAPPQYDFVKSCLEGSSYYKLNPVLQWINANINVHHIHHLAPKIPNYELQRCMDENPLFQSPRVVPFWSGFRCALLKVWDEDRRRLVTWREAEEALRAAPAAAERSAA